MQHVGAVRRQGVPSVEQPVEVMACAKVALGTIAACFRDQASIAAEESGLREDR